jgi:hypothetical protein
MTQNYEKYRLPKLWEMVADEDPETGFTHVNTLNRLRTALEQQRDNLRTHRDRLAEGWPPDRSEAAAAFILRINEMIDTMTDTAAATGRICVGVDEVFAAIREARRQMEQLVANYSKRAPGQGLTVPTAGNAELDQQGRNVLMAADARVAQAAPMLGTVVPTLTRIDNSGHPLTQSGSGSDGFGGGVESTAIRRPSRGNVGQPTMLRPPTFDPPVSDGDGAAIGPDAQFPVGGDSPVLAGGSTDQLNTSGGGGSASYPVPGTVGVIGGNTGPNHTVWTPISGGVVQPRGVGPGGVIGAPRASNVGGGQFIAAPATGISPQTGSAQVGRRNPTGRPPASPQAAEWRESDGAAAGYRDRSFETYARRRRSKHDNEDAVWPVGEGISPILESTTEQDHDPGPGVLGIDR